MLEYILNNLNKLVETLDTTMYFETGVSKFELTYELPIDVYLETQKHFLGEEDLETDNFIVELNIYENNKILLTFKIIEYVKNGV